MMEPVTWISSAVGQELVARLMAPPEPGAGLVDQPIRLGGWVSWRFGRKRSIVARDVRKLVRKVALQAIDADPSLRVVEPEDRQKVADAVAAALMALDTITMDVVQASHLDANRLADLLNTSAHNPGAFQKATERQLYGILLQGCCLQLVEFFSRRPEFTARTAVEQSKLLGDLHERMPDSARAIEVFEQRYRNAVVALYDRMQVFGLGLPPEEQTYQLTTAYVSLSVQDVGKGRDHGKRNNEEDDYRVTRGAGQRFEDILATNSRVLLEGPAGSGKTTLLRRLTLHMCKGDLPEQLAGWRHTIPFPLRLRDFVHGDSLALPRSDDFVHSVIKSWGAVQPAGWIDGLLEDQRAVLLIDGIDEVPGQHRGAVLEWLEQFATLYSRSRLIVTSRPTALNDAYRRMLRLRGFTTVRLEPMTPGQVDLFIDRWHNAVRSEPADFEVLRDRAQALKDALSTRRDLARLATNPLLCAMLCALNRNLNTELPRGRVALYRAALTMLLERRDSEQRIAIGPIQLTQGQAQAFLSQLAIWMTQEGRRTIPRMVALAQVEDLLPRLRYSLSGARPSSEQVIQYLLERSGLLQDPTLDLLEFRHASFQDYLAAAEVVRRNNIGHVIRFVHDPLYHDIVIMMVGQTQDDEAQQSTILNGLMARADSDHEYSRRLWLLAAACIADVEMVDPELANRIQSETAKLLPPGDLDEAEAIAAAGDFVLDLLAEAAVRRKLTPYEAAATVQAAALIGGAHALSVLRLFRRHPSAYVRGALAEAWLRSRTPEEYVNTVLAEADLSDVLIYVSKPEHIQLLTQLRNLRSLEIGEFANLAPLANLASLRYLRIANIEISDIGPLAGLSSLEELNLSGNPVADIKPLARLTALRTLDLSNTRVVDIVPLRSLTYLRDLSLEETQVTNISPLADLTSLERLLLQGTDVTDLQPLARLTALRYLFLDDTRVSDIRPLAELMSLEELSRLETEVADLTPLTNLTRLQLLDVGRTNVSDISPLVSLVNLRTLNIARTEIIDTRPLIVIPNLNIIGRR